MWRRKWTLVAALAIGLGAAAYRVHSTPRTYRAEAVLQATGQEATETNDPRIGAGANGVIRVWAEAGDPQSAARSANALAQDYIEQDALARRRSEEATMQSLETRLAEVDRDLAVLRQETLSNNDSVKRRVEINHGIHDAILSRMQQAAISSAMAGSNIRWVARAQPPAEPKPTGTSREMGFGALAGIGLGLCAVGVRHRTDRTVRTPFDALIAPLLTSLGTIPRMPQATKRFLRRTGEAPLLEQIAWEEKDSAPAESFRGVLASILDTHNGDSRAVRTLVITSPRPGEGKTTVASNLAIALAGTERRVLLIDADLRRPRLHAVFDLANTSGLSELLCAHSSVLELAAQQMVKATKIPNLSLLPSGPGADGIFNRLYSARVRGLLGRFREAFDYVIIDTPPALEAADARVLARSSDGVIVVLRANRSRTTEALETASQFLRDRVPVIGAVLNDWPARAARAADRASYYSAPQYRGARGDQDSEIPAAMAAAAARLRPTQQG